ncbi:MAG: cupin-like domain-containing protein [Pseudoxanthomonas sp.]
MAALAPIVERHGCRPGALPIVELLEANVPVVLRGVARDWPLVHAGLQGPLEAMAALRRYDSGRPMQYSYGGPQIGGRPFYDETFTELNTEVRTSTLSVLLEQIAAHLHDARPPTYYLASLPVDPGLQGFATDHGLDLAAHGMQVQPSIWVGNRTIASCHYDAPNNLACCVVGRRRVTVFPPDQITNLYPGPLAPTPGGQAVSLVDFADPDLVRYPRFADALVNARTAVLEPGDVLFIPSMWWHQVEGLASFNVLVNYWWSSVPAHMPAPTHALYHALWTIRDRPDCEKQAWRAVFDYYVFGPADQAGAHLPEQARQMLGPIDAPLARQLRAMLIAKLNR